MARLFFVVLFGLILYVAPRALAEEPKKAEPEKLPPPRELVEKAVELPPLAPFVPQRINRYDVWQYYAVDNLGRFRPRVIYAPTQPYYLYNGKPYYYAPVHP